MEPVEASNEGFSSALFLLTFDSLPPTTTFYHVSEFLQLVEQSADFVPDLAA